MAGITIRIKDGTGADRDVAAYANSDGNLTPGSVPLVAGAPISGSNRMPVDPPPGGATVAAQNTANTALGTPDDVAYGGSGAAGIIATLKGLYALLKGTLTTTLTQGGAPLSSANALPVSLPASASTAAAQAVSNAALGAPGDASWVSGAGTIVAILKRISGALTGALTVKAVAIDTVPNLVDIGVNSVAVVAANPDRRFLMVLNQGANDVWLRHGTAAAVAGVGQLVRAGTGFIWDGVAVPNTALTGVTASGTSQLFFVQG